MNKQLIEEKFSVNWWSKLNSEFDKDYMKKIYSDIIISVNQGNKVKPCSKDLYNQFKICDYDKVSVVLLLKFPIVDHRQPVMEYISKTIEETCYKGLHLNLEANLEYLYSQGVLVLPLFHTVNMNDKNNIVREWGLFTKVVLQYLNNHSDRLIFIYESSDEVVNLLRLSGEGGIIIYSNMKSKLINLNHHNLLSLSDKQCFNKANQLLTKYGRKKIEW